MSDNAVRPKLAVSGASDALQWYADVLDAVLGDRYQAGEQVVFAELEVLGTTITLKDADGADPVPQPGPILDCVVDDADAVATPHGGGRGRGRLPRGRSAVRRARRSRARPVRGAVAAADAGHDDARRGRSGRSPVDEMSDE